MFGGQENGKDKTEMLRLEFTCCLYPLRNRDEEKRIGPEIVKKTTERFDNISARYFPLI